MSNYLTFDERLEIQKGLKNQLSFGKCTLKKYVYDAEDAHPEYPVVQMDSVCGTKGGKVLLTIHFVDTSFMLAFIRDANTSILIKEKN